MNDLHIAFQEDALASSHSLSPPQEDVQTTTQITEMFDSITYSKVIMVISKGLRHRSTHSHGIKIKKSGFYTRYFSFSSSHLCLCTTDTDI